MNGSMGPPGTEQPQNQIAQGLELLYTASQFVPEWVLILPAVL